MKPYFTLIENGEIYSPHPLGRASLLFAGEEILRIGKTDLHALEKTGLGFEIIDAQGCYVVPGLIDPHQHLIGGSGEKGFQSQTPEIHASEILSAGITTVVGCLGVDTVTKCLPSLLGRVKALNAEGLSAYLYSGGYDVPPITLTGSIKKDILYIQEVIGAGEIAISDRRSCQPTPSELAKLVSEAYIAGTLTGKSGVTHFHVGPGKSGLSSLFCLLDEYEISPSSLYPTHVERNETLMGEAVQLTRRGVTVDIDTVENDLVKWLQFSFDRDLDPRFITLSSDAAISSPSTLYRQFQEAAKMNIYPFEKLLAMVTSNTAHVLKLSEKGQLQPHFKADLLILEKSTYELRDVISKGRHWIKNGSLQFHEQFLEASNRRISLYGKKSE